MKVIVTGSISYDFIMDFPGRFSDRIMADKIHQISLSFLVDHLEKQFGGIGTNISYNLKLLGVEPVLVAAAGKDFAPFAAFLRKHRIATSSVRVHKDVSTSSYFVVTDKEDNQIGAFYVGAQKYAPRLSLSGLSGDLVIVAPTDPLAMKKRVAECKSLGLQYVYDPAFQIATFSAEELREGIDGAKILFGNDYEIALIEDKLEISHEELILMVPVVVTTLGSKGSIIETRTESIHVSIAKPKAVVDPTGAGDAYRAGFLAGYLKNLDLAVCGQMGSTAAAYAVETYGTVAHHFTKKEFLKRYRHNFGNAPAL